jgi:indolepyruvate ferredoxin oxidoreductase alpha subunit
MVSKKLLLGNEAIARGLVENGCAVATSYPGTPASEILTAVAHWSKVDRHSFKQIQWAVNEKVAFEIAYAAAMTGLRTAVSMKQVGLNVASDPLMSSVYMGTKGGFVVISADDPGPHSSQTEQDSRLMAMLARVPVLDPDSPAQAKEMVGLGFALSEAFAIPVMLRPTTRVCHARQDVTLNPIRTIDVPAQFEKNPARWAATPKFRYQLHCDLEEKLAQIAVYAPTAPLCLNPSARGDFAIVASGVAAAHTAEILQTLNLWERYPFFQVRQPFPLHTAFVETLLNTYKKILVIEETADVIELQLADRGRVLGKQSGMVPRVGELTPAGIHSILCRFTRRDDSTAVLRPPVGRRPTLCAGCPHRASFYAIRKAAPRGIYTSDIGCYTLGLNLGAVDTVLCMGAAISQAAGFYHAFKGQKAPPDIVATIGDSTFFHAGIPALIDAVVQRVRFLLVILDNRTTAMTGNQPTPATGLGATGEKLQPVDIETLVKGCGVTYCKTGDPYEIKTFITLLKDALAFAGDQGPAVVVARRPCLLDKRHLYRPVNPGLVQATDQCDGCGYCVERFECPALVLRDEADDQQKVTVDSLLCSGCGVCLQVCPKGALVPLDEEPV